MSISEIEKVKTCCFTGHRSLPKEKEAEQALMWRLKALIEKAIDEDYTHFISGGAVGFDMLAAEMVLFYKMELKLPVKLEIAVPCTNQDAKYSKEQKLRYDWILQHADYIRPTALPYHKGCYMLRNKYMVNNSSLIIAYYEDGKAGGTKNTLEYAKRNNKEIWYI